MQKFIPIFVIISLLLCSCKKDLLKGIDKGALFASPTTQELQAVEAAWKQRSLSPTEIITESSVRINANLELKMISYMLDGDKQYAAVLLPASAVPLPIQIYISGFGLDQPVSSQAITTDPNQPLPFVYVLPALKGQSLSLTINGTTYNSPVSQGTRNDAFDGAADDGIAAVNAVISSYPQADPAKAIVRGGSRGATVALLMGIRDKRIKRVVSVAGPTDLVRSTKDHQNDPTYRFQFLDKLINGTETLTEARARLIASSPLFFSRLLPKTQLHLGEADQIVPTWNGELLLQKMQAEGNQTNFELFVYKGRNHENITNGNMEMDGRIKVFLQPLFASD